ncbi:hypothetical protein CEXT_201301 [Caerostris extrusa]|uniref:Uncharacterized protein n=1 Tax=Caerostris extrusa TaxID=172846 RepID=A0AAV4P0S9_CAEEX|nr:hypothetical protein CEXT_201301 [Caerostris extrusa]
MPQTKLHETRTYWIQHELSRFKGLLEDNDYQYRWSGRTLALIRSCKPGNADNRSHLKEKAAAVGFFVLTPVISWNGKAV